MARSDKFRLCPQNAPELLASRLRQAKIHTGEAAPGARLVFGGGWNDAGNVNAQIIPLK